MNSTPISLIFQLREPNNSEAWNRFTQLYTPLLFYWARRIGLSPHEAEDLLQDLLLHLLEKLTHFEHRGPGTFRAWLRTVTTNKCRERLRRRSVTTTSDTQVVEALAAAADPFWETEYRQRLISRALEVMQAEFEPTTWRACWQRVVEGRSAAEVARDLNISENTVYVYTGRVLRRLREQLRDLID
jgi:RNA polymerase sigma-70 factor, ECF subfamily